MNPTTILLVMQTITALAEGILQVRATFDQANAEGRDLTDAELQNIKALRQAAFDRLMNTP